MCQRAYTPYTERPIQTGESNPVADDSVGNEHPAHSWPILHGLVPQETYRPARQARLIDSRIIYFIVNGEMGIRLSDASKGNWMGFEGRDDRALFEGNRTQIMLRLLVRLPVDDISICCANQFSFQA